MTASLIFIAGLLYLASFAVSLRRGLKQGRAAFFEAERPAEGAGGFSRTEIAVAAAALVLQGIALLLRAKATNRIFPTADAFDVLELTAFLFAFIQITGALIAKRGLAGIFSMAAVAFITLSPFLCPELWKRGFITPPAAAAQHFGAGFHALWGGMGAAVAFATGFVGMLYFVQKRALKSRIQSALLCAVPSVTALQKSVCFLSGFGAVCTACAMALGAFCGGADSPNAPDFKIASALLLFLLQAFTAVAGSSGRLSGRTVAAAACANAVAAGAMLIIVETAV